MLKQNLLLIENAKFFETKQPLFYILYFASRLKLECFVSVFLFLTIIVLIQDKKYKTALFTSIFTGLVYKNFDYFIYADEFISLYSAPFFLFSLLYVNDNYFMMATFLSVGFCFNLSFRLIIGVYMVATVGWFKRSIKSGKRESYINFAKLMFSCLLLPVFYLVSVYLQTYLRFSSQAIRFSNEFQQSLKNSPTRDSADYVLDRSVIQIKGEMGYLNYGIEEEVESTVKEENVEKKIKYQRSKANTTKETSLAVKVTKMHKEEYTGFDQMNHDDMIIKNNDRVKLTTFPGGLTMTYKNLKDEKEKFADIQFVKHETNIPKLEFKVVFDSKGSVLRSKKTYFRLRDNMDRWLTQLKDGSYTVSHYGRKDAQLFVVDDSLTAPNFQAIFYKTSDEYDKLGRFGMVREILYKTLDGNKGKLKKEYVKEKGYVFYKSTFGLFVFVFNLVIIFKNLVFYTLKRRDITQIVPLNTILYFSTLDIKLSEFIGLLVLEKLNLSEILS